MGQLVMSKKYGLNPSVRVCPCCEKSMDLVLFGTSYKDSKGNSAKAPMYVAANELCDECKKVINEGGIFFIEVKDGEMGRQNPSRTGRMVAVKEDAVKSVISQYSKINYVEQSLFSKLFGNLLKNTCLS